MKKLLLAFITLAVATAFGAPAFAAVTDAKTKAECEKAGGIWIESPKNAELRNQSKEPFTRGHAGPER